MYCTVDKVELKMSGMVTKITQAKKKPIVPTLLVIAKANLSNAESLLRWVSLGFFMGEKRSFNCSRVVILSMFTMVLGMLL